MIGNLQTIRIFAASGVVIYHCNAHIFGVHTEFFGVALFFVLSGYLMCRVRDRSAFDFICDRFWRILPSYWLIMAIMLTGFNMWLYWPIEHTVLSIFFIPHVSAAGMHPVLGVAWTLNMEVYFYVIFAFSIMLNRKYSPIICLSIIILIKQNIAKVTSNEALIFYYTHGYINFFLYGIAIWYVSEALNKIYIKTSAYIFPLLTFVYMACVINYESIPYFSADIATSLLFLIAIVTANKNSDISHPVILLFGNASYACYLIHTILIEALRHLGIATSGTFLFTFNVLVLSWSLAIIWFFFVEKRIGWMRRKLRQGSPQSV